MLNVRDENPDVLTRLEEVIGRMVDEFKANGPCPRYPGAHPHRTTDYHGCQAPTGNRERQRRICCRRVSAHAERSRPRHQSLSAVMPVGMLFVPSIGGISHHWTENTSDTDIVRGAQVFVDAARRLLTQ